MAGFLTSVGRRVCRLAHKWKETGNMLNATGSYIVGERVCTSLSRVGQYSGYYYLYYCLAVLARHGAESCCFRGYANSEEKDSPSCRKRPIYVRRVCLLFEV